MKMPKRVEVDNHGTNGQNKNGWEGGSAGKLRELSGRLTELQKKFPLEFKADAPRSSRALLDETVEELHVTVEELRVANEMLTIQNGELAEAQEAVEAERRRYQDLFDFSPEALLITDLDATIQEANKAAAMLLNVEQRFLSGKPLVVFIEEDERKEFRSKQLRLRQVLSRMEWNHRLQPRGQEAFSASLHICVVKDRHGVPQGLRWLVKSREA